MERVDNNFEQPSFMYETISPGIEKYTLDLQALYPDPSDRQGFEKRWLDFYHSDPANIDIMWKDGDQLVYLSESIVPTVDNGKMPVVLLFGNPAPHSIKQGMFFSYEGNGREHRIWRILRQVGLLQFPETLVTPTDLNQTRKKQLFELDYDSPFRISFLPYISLPSTSSQEPWTGVTGVQRLFGSRVLRVIEQMEQQRIKGILEQFMPNEGLVLAFQKNAYNGLKAVDAPVYGRDAAIEANLLSQYPYQERISIAGIPPTRSLNGTKAKMALKTIIDRFI